MENLNPQAQNNQSPATKKKKTRFIIWAIILIFAVAAGVFYIIQQYSNPYRIKTIKLSPPSDSQTASFETDKVVLTFSLNDLRPLLQSSPTFLAEVEEKSKNNEKIFSEDYLDFKALLEYSLIDLLKAGKFKLFDKKSGTYIQKIRVYEYFESCGPLCGSGGMRYDYILPNGKSEILLETVDIIS